MSKNVRKINEYLERNITDKFLCNLFDDVAVVHASSMVLERAFDPQARLVVQPQIEVAPAKQP